MLFESMLLKLCVAFTWLAAAGVTWQAISRLKVFAIGGHYEGAGGAWWLPMLLLVLQVSAIGYVFFVRS